MSLSSSHQSPLPATALLRALEQGSRLKCRHSGPRRGIGAFLYMDWTGQASCPVMAVWRQMQCLNRPVHIENEWSRDPRTPALLRYALIRQRSNEYIRKHRTYFKFTHIGREGYYQPVMMMRIIGSLEDDGLTPRLGRIWLVLPSRTRLCSYYSLRLSVCLPIAGEIN